MKFASIDFEYYDTAEEKLTLVCCSIKHDDTTRSFWTHRSSSGISLACDYINFLHSEGYTFIAYNVVAEASSFISLGLGSPLKYNWIDLYLEYRCLSNHNDNYAYGKQLINGRIKTTRRPLPKWQRKTEADEKKAESQKQEYGYGAAVFKTQGIVIDNDFKKEIRDLIIACNSGNEEDIQAMVCRKDEILQYCESDVKYLEPMLMGMLNEYKRLLGERYNPVQLKSDMRNRSEYACRTAIMERKGYPIDENKTRNFSDQVPNILWECQTDINSQFDYYGDDRIFRNKTKIRPLDLSWNQKKSRNILREWIKDNNFKNWTLTDGGKSGIKDLSLSLKAFQKPISYNHTYKKGNFISQMQRYLKLKQGLNGFTSGGKKNFWDSFGKDGRVRPYMGIYGAQSSRSQPSATAFIPLKSAWMRVLIQAPKGKAICGIDFASQEFLLAALLSGDEKMLRAYESGDVYLAFGKDIKYIPKDGSKKQYKKERDNCKAVVLGLSYDMSEYGLAFDLTEKFGRIVSTEEALGWITKHKNAYPKFWAWKERLTRSYEMKKHIRLADGWYLWGDNDNFRSVGNAPVQGMGACIMRKAVALAQDAGLDIIYTLHDALYIEMFIKNKLRDPAILAQCMDEAFRFYFPEEMKKVATVRLDADIWGLDCSEKNYDLSYASKYGTYTMPVKEQIEYIDERGIEEYNKFKKYFEEVDYGSAEF